MFSTVEQTELLSSVQNTAATTQSNQILLLHSNPQDEQPKSESWSRYLLFYVRPCLSVNKSVRKMKNFLFLLDGFQLSLLIHSDIHQNDKQICVMQLFNTIRTKCGGKRLVVFQARCKMNFIILH